MFTKDPQIRPSSVDLYIPDAKGLLQATLLTGGSFLSIFNARHRALATISGNYKLSALCDPDLQKGIHAILTTRVDGTSAIARLSAGCVGHLDSHRDGHLPKSIDFERLQKADGQPGQFTRLSRGLCKLRTPIRPSRGGSSGSDNVLAALYLCSVAPGARRSGWWFIAIRGRLGQRECPDAPKYKEIVTR
jgi:hypothetical protein